jgi:hypothetical protein
MKRGESNVMKVIDLRPLSIIPAVAVGCQRAYRPKYLVQRPGALDHVDTSSSPSLIQHKKSRNQP